MYFGHSANRKGSPWEPLREHVSPVAERAKSYATQFGGAEEALIAGYLHDLGKYGELFKLRLKNQVSGLDHWSAGMLAAVLKYREKAFAAALAVQGHHVGLQSGLGSKIKEMIDTLSNPPEPPIRLKLTEPNVQIGDARVLQNHVRTLLGRLNQDGISLPNAPANSLYSQADSHFVASMLDVRMLFSALVDADYIETEAHFEGHTDGTKVYRPDGPALDASRARHVLSECIAGKRRDTHASEDVRVLRERLLNDCSSAADKAQGIFTLTAPTGSGKTLAMLEFALRHAEKYSNIRRIVVVIPFLTIIEQTARIYRELFEPTLGPLCVIEHHSLSDVSPRERGSAQTGLGGDNEDEYRRIGGLLAENWDAPIILTTSVQFFESLFANRPAKCRKLHRLANSIILFDEAQTLPPRLAVPTLAALSRLTERYGCSIVFSTATQPAFDHLNTLEGVRKYAVRGWAPTPIVAPEEQVELFSLARRVKVEWLLDRTTPWEAIAGELAAPESSQALCVVNLKRHAQKLAGLLNEKVGPDGLFHLSTSMCPAHREAALTDVRTRLVKRNRRPCRLIATQCIEAGVDVDFPVVYRAFGPLDAIAQAAGRCNREGRLPGLGRMVVFKPEKVKEREYLYPPGGYKEAADTTETLLKLKRHEAEGPGISNDVGADICDPALFDTYYRMLYDLTGVATRGDENREGTLENALALRCFVDVAERYRIIDQNTINVLVPYQPEMALFEELKERLATDGRLTREWIRDARSLTISLFSPKDGDPIQNFLGSVPLAHGVMAEDWFIYLNPDHYDPLLGLVPPDACDASIT